MAITIGRKKKLMILIAEADGDIREAMRRLVELNQSSLKIDSKEFHKEFTFLHNEFKEANKEYKRLVKEYEKEFGGT